MFRFAILLIPVIMEVCFAADSGAPGPQTPHTAWYEGFEGAEPSWRPVGGNTQYRIELHQRVRGEAHTGDGCERLRVAGSGGSEVFIGHDVGRPRIIDELLLTVWVKADRPGIQVAAQVVLPRSADPRTGRPISAVLYGSSYTMVGRWQQLRLDDLPRLLMRQTRVLRSQYGPNVDPREAYVERILLNVYGGPGVTNVSIDDLDIAGFVGPPKESDQFRSPLPLPSDAGPSASPGTAAAGSPPTATAGRGRIRLSGSVLLVEDRPTFPRIIQYQGEPLEFLRKLGFNAIWLSQLPTGEMLQESRRLGLWLICPPPYPLRPAGTEEAEVPLPEIALGYDRVLAWDLGAGLGMEQLPAVTRWAKQIKTADRHESGRPLVCRPTSELRGYSRVADLLILGRSPLGTSLELTAYGTWIRQLPQLTVPGTPMWTTVQTQPPASVRQQWAAVAPGVQPPANFSPEQVRLLVYTAVIAGSRGLLFESFSPLSANDPAARNRALTLELLNLELDLVEPWAAAGSVVATVPGSEPGVFATLLQTEHGRLLVPIWSAPRAQFVSGQSAGHGIGFVVPGVPETNKAYIVLPGGLHPFQPPRKAGGVRITLDEFDLTGQVLLTQNPLVVSGLSQRAVRTGRRAAELQREVAATKLEMVAEISGQLTARGVPVAQSADWLAMARKNLQQSDGFLTARDDASAYLHAQRAMRPLRLLERAHWDAANAALRTPVASPAAVSFATLPGHWAMMQRLGDADALATRLPGGEFEDLGSLFETGWRHLQHPLPGMIAEAELTPAAAHSGRFGLRLSARPAQPGNPLLLVESPPIWVTSPVVQVQAGELLRIQGWIKIPVPIAGSVDGLLIVDSLGGEPLAERIVRTNGWEQFTLYRVAPQSGSMSITIALSGLGEAFLDDVTIQPLLPARSPNYRQPAPAASARR